MSGEVVLLVLMIGGGILLVPVITLIMVIMQSSKIAAMGHTLEQIANQLKAIQRAGAGGVRRESASESVVPGAVPPATVVATEQKRPAAPVDASATVVASAPPPLTAVVPVAVERAQEAAVPLPPADGAKERVVAASVAAGAESGRVEVEAAPSAVDQVLAKAWNWFVVGDTYRKPGESWEFAVATNWLLRLGILIVLAGVAFFLKYSIEKGLMGPLGRVSLSLAAGVGLIVLGLRLLFKRYHLLGQGLSGAGFVMLYFAFYAASSMYHLIPNGMAFALMAAVTVSAGGLAVVHSSMGIALLGLLGGYATPAMVGQAGGSQLLFYSYILMLGGGVLVLSLVRRWPVLNGLGMLAAYGLIFFYCWDHRAISVLSYDLAATTAVHLLYLFSVIAHYLRGRERSGAFEWWAICLNCLLYGSWVYVLFEPVFGGESVGLIALALSAVYLGLFYSGQRRRVADQRAQLIFVSFAALFLALAPVFMLTREWLTFAWSLLALVIMLIGRRSGERRLVRLAVALFVVACLRWFVVDLTYFYEVSGVGYQGGSEFWRGVSLRCLLLGITPAALCGAWRMVRGHRHAGKVLAVVLVQLLIVLTSETGLIATVYAYEFREGAVTLSWVVFAFALLFSGIRVGGKWLRWCGLALFGMAVVKLLLSDLERLETLYRIIAFITTGVILVLGAFLYLKYKHLFESERESASEGEVENV